MTLEQAACSGHCSFIVISLLEAPASCKDKQKDRRERSENATLQHGQKPRLDNPSGHSVQLVCMRNPGRWRHGSLQVILRSCFPPEAKGCSSKSIRTRSKRKVRVIRASHAIRQSKHSMIFNCKNACRRWSSTSGTTATRVSPREKAKA